MKHPQGGLIIAEFGIFSWQDAMFPFSAKKNPRKPFFIGDYKNKLDISLERPYFHSG